MLRWILLFVFIIIQNAFEKWKKNTEKGFWWKKTKTHSNPAIRIGATSNILLSQIKVTVPSELSAWCLKNALIIWNANISNSSLSRTVFTIPRAHFPLYLELLQKIKQKETTPNSNFMFSNVFCKFCFVLQTNSHSEDVKNKTKTFSKNFAWEISKSKKGIPNKEVPFNYGFLETRYRTVWKTTFSKQWNLPQKRNESSKKVMVTLMVLLSRKKPWLTQKNLVTVFCKLQMDG